MKKMKPLPHRKKPQPEHDPERKGSNIPQQLRELADEIERGEMQDVRTAYVVMCRKGGRAWPDIHGMGYTDLGGDCVLQLGMARAYLMMNIVAEEDVVEDSISDYMEGQPK